MTSDKERFFNQSAFAVVGNSALAQFPLSVYQGLQRRGKRVYPVELGGARYVQGDEAFASLRDVPNDVQAAIVDLPRRKLLPVIEQAAERKLSWIWLQPGDCIEAEAACRERGLRVIAADARPYVREGFSLSRLLLKVSGRY